MILRFSIDITVPLTTGVVVDPLAELASEFGAELDDLGYSTPGAEAQLRLMRQLPIWLAGQGFAVADPTVEVAEQYVAARRFCRRAWDGLLVTDRCLYDSRRV
jgi:hypothetical protein